MINEFIDKILVHAPYYIDGERMQEVEIYLNFIGKFEIPQPQLSEEEIKRQKQLKQPASRLHLAARAVTRYLNPSTAMLC